MMNKNPIPTVECIPQVYHHHVESCDSACSYTWEQEACHPFNELIVSWNASRPSCGQYRFLIAVKTENWSDWFPYSVWEACSQSGGKAECTKIPLKINQDTVELLDGVAASAFCVRIEACDGAPLDQISSLHACTSVMDTYSESFECLSEPFEYLSLDVPSISQMMLDHPRGCHMCSPTSAAAVVSYLTGEKVDVVEFALKARDHAFDIFGNWVLNTAQAADHLRGHYTCWVQRLSGFKDILEQLRTGMPVIVSVRGPLAGSAQEYRQGHLIVVKGYDAKQKRVLCMDPAFLSDDETDVGYGLEDFLSAWARRRNIAYLFAKDLTLFSAKC